jgi:hypothetical protein
MDEPYDAKINIKFSDGDFTEVVCKLTEGGHKLSSSFGGVFKRAEQIL